VTTRVVDYYELHTRRARRAEAGTPAKLEGQRSGLRTNAIRKAATATIWAMALAASTYMAARKTKRR
jgi:hypothetical protein